MGLEATCFVRAGQRRSEGKARLEEKTLQFRGDFSLTIPFDTISFAEARRGELAVQHAAGTAVFELGSAAEKWALKIRYPRPLIEKLGVKSGHVVTLVGMDDRSLIDQMTERGARVSARVKAGADVIFLGAETRKALDRIASLEPKLQRTGFMWVVYPKGQKHITQADVMSATRHAGLVDVKIVSYSETHSALKLMVPLNRR